MIEVSHISKSFKVYKSTKNSKHKLRSIFSREYDIKAAVDDISFTIGDGELVGYVGPNGAGKSTTIKMLSGILTPTSGRIVVDGRVPYEQRQENAKHIGVVFGQRSQLYWDLPMTDTFQLHRRMYEIPEEIYRRNVDLFIEVLQMGSFIHQPVRQLSLGQKMRANIAIALLHDPKIVFLDEPTIGLDIVAKSRIRDFVKEINKLKGTTFLLTTHDMEDIEQICDRLILIDRGKLGYDGCLAAFRRQYGDAYQLRVTLERGQVPQHPLLTIVEAQEDQFMLTGSSRELPAAKAIAYLTENYGVRDIHIHESNLENILKAIFQNEKETNIHHH